MPVAVWWVVAAVAGYDLGAVNPAAIVAKVFGVDLRSTGSGNPGATNVGRALGPRWAVLVGFLDILKGFVPAVVFGTLVGQTAGEIAGIAAVVGGVVTLGRRVVVVVVIDGFGVAFGGLEVVVEAEPLAVVEGADRGTRATVVPPRPGRPGRVSAT